MSHYHATDWRFYEWEARQERIRERREKMRRFVPPPVEKEPTNRPVSHDESITIEVGNPPTYDNLPKAEVHGVCHSRGAVWSDGEAYPLDMWDWVQMTGDPVHIGRVLIEACDAYLKCMEEDDG